MRILWVKANKLLPLHSGGDIRSFHILKYLVQHHQVSLLSYYDGLQDLTYEADLKKHFPDAISLCSGSPQPSFTERGFNYLQHLRFSEPYAVSRFRSKAVKGKIESLLSNKDMDVAVADFLDAAVNFPGESEVPRVLFQHNVESEIWRRHAETASNLIRRSLYSFEFRKMLRYERETVRKFTHVIAVSVYDSGLMQEWIDGSKVSVVPTGVDLQQYKPASKHVDEKSLVMFVGAMDWQPNVDAVEFFCSETWQRVKAGVPDARLCIVGRNPTANIRNLASASIEVTGRVASVSDYLQRAAVVIVPLRIGGGTRLKIYEAMAAEKAVVSTTIGAEGLDVTNGKDIVIADHPEEFSAAVISLLNDPVLRRRYARSAFETASKYDWSSVAAQFDEVLQGVTNSPRSFPH